MEPIQEQSIVHVVKANEYDVEQILASLPINLFNIINPGESVVIKPNWVMESHRLRPDDWEHVITHPTMITAVLKVVLKRLCSKGSITIIDGPMTEANFAKLISRYPVVQWQQLAANNGIELKIVDLREHEWVMKNDVIIERKVLPGDPKGKVQVDLLDENSEFFGHNKSHRGYFGADYDRAETNRAHDGYHNLYSVSRTVIEADVFINMPKLKTHRIAGITCCLKNLVGINTYKNYLPHFSEGGPAEGGDQFPMDNFQARIEGPVAAFLKQNVLKYPAIATYLTSLNTIGKKLFGDSKIVVRNGSWYGNNTIWRMICDLNKILLYANSDGTMRKQAKKYIGVVDAILAGEGEGPLSPEPIAMGRIICGSNPVAIDTVCASLMGFDHLKIPTVINAFSISNYPLCDFNSARIETVIDGESFGVDNIPAHYILKFMPQHGWAGYIEKNE